jgi:cytochrome oxidase assembly protein ShyY1
MMMSSFMGSSSPSSVTVSSHASTATGTLHRSQIKKPWFLYALIGLTLLLGVWQAYRAHYKQGLADAYAAGQQLAPRTWHGGPLADWQRVQPQGRWLGDKTFQLAPRFHEGRPGSEVVTPLALVSGEIVLVNRGWIADGQTPPAAPATVPQIETQSWPRFFELGPTPPQGRRLQNLTAERAAQLAGTALPIAYAHQLDGAADGLLRDWPKPDFKVARHLGYMLTWWACSLCGLLLLRRLKQGAPR